MSSGTLTSGNSRLRQHGLPILSALVSTMLTLSLLGAAALALAHRFLPAIVERGLGDVVEVRALEIEAISSRRIELAIASVSTEQISFVARQIVVLLDQRPLRVRGVEIDHAELSILPGSTDTVGSLFMPSLPFPLQIESLELRAATALGEVFLPASIVAGPTVGGCFEAELVSPELSAVLTSSAGGDATLSLYSTRGAEMLRLDTSLGAGEPMPFRARLTPRPLGEWAHETRLLPAALKGTIEPFTIEGTPIELTGVLAGDGELTVDMRGRLAVEDARSAGARVLDSALIESRAGYSIERTRRGWSGAGQARIDLSPSAEVNLVATDPDWRWDDEGLTLALTQPELPAQGVAAETLEITVPELAADAAAGSVQLTGLRLADSTVALPAYDVDGRWSWRDSALEASGTGRADALPEAAWTLQAASGKGRFAADLSGQMTDLMPSVKALLPPLVQRVQIRSGSLSGHYRLAWADAQRETNLSADITGIDADLEAMGVRGLEIRLHNSGDQLEPLRLRIRTPRLQLAAGAVAEDLAATLRASRRKLHIDHARARLLGGELALRPASIPLGRDFVLITDIDALSLPRIMDLLDQPRLALTGAVSGRLDVRYSVRDGLSATGAFRGIEPGTLRLRLGGETAQTGQINHLALRALEDFRYRELSADIAYSSDDAYQISARIVGSNPEVLDGHPFAFNPRIEGRLPALFKAFFITGDFNRAIIDSLQSR